MLQDRHRKWELDENAALFCKPGAVKEEGGIRFTAAALPGQEAVLYLFEKKSGKLLQKVDFPQEAAIGDLRTVKLIGLPWRRVAYCFKLGGEWTVDPYAGLLLPNPAAEQEKEEPEMLCGMAFDDYDWQGDRRPDIPYEEAVMYHLHVRNYTKHPKSRVRHKGTFLGLQEKLPYLSELGVNQVKLMPVYETAWEEKPKRSAALYYTEKPGARKQNFWGYGPGCYFAPKSLFAATSDPVRELKDMVRAFHEKGIEVLLEMFFLPDTPVRLALDCLTYWVREYHIDGFHIMGNEQLGNCLRGDALLAGTKLIVSSVSAWDWSKPFRRNFAECNDGFLVNARRILKGDEGILESFVFHARQNFGHFGVINYLTNHDGFTLNDLVSYDNKHNEENGEQNQDGAAYNFSWNCGVEGPSRKKSVLALRKKQMRNAFLLMLLSQGTPMLLAGDEFCNSQGGNNNPYCLDSPVSWVDWGAFEKNRDMVEFVKRAIAFRREHAVLHMPRELKLTDYISCGYPDLSYHSSRAWYGGFEYNSRQVGMMYCGKYAGDEDFLYVAYNLHPLEQELALPALPAGMVWKKVIDTSQEDSFAENDSPEFSEKSGIFPARTILVLAGKKE